jgi:hypothetical protein
VSATPEQPPAAPDEPVTAIHEPTSAAPPIPPGESHISVSLPDTSELTEKHPEILVGGAFVGGAVLALVLKRLGRG